MPPQAPAPTQRPSSPVNPIMMALLRARAQSGAGGAPVGPAPNGLPINGAVPPPAPSAAASVMAPRPAGGGTPNQQVMKAAAQAQSPLMDNQTRQIAKTLIQKLMQHM